jgi:hypothetical protein
VRDRNSVTVCQITAMTGKTKYIGFLQVFVLNCHKNTLKGRYYYCATILLLKIIVFTLHCGCKVINVPSYLEHSDLMHMQQIMSFLVSNANPRH